MNIPYIEFDYTKSECAELEIIDLSSLYACDNLSHDPQQPHKVSFFLFLFIEKGQGRYMVDFEEYDFAAGSMFFIQQEQVHAFDFSSKPQGTVLLFTQSFLDQIHSNMRLPNYSPTYLNRSHSPLLRLDPANFQRSLTLISEMKREIEQAHPHSLIIMYLFSTLALLLDRQKAPSNFDELSCVQNTLLTNFFTLMQQHFSTTREASWYADQLHITYKTLNKLCKTATDLTAKQMIDAFTIMEIKRHLVTSKVSSQQMAYDFGFEDTSNFIKYFKKQTNLTPSQFQKKYQFSTFQSSRGVRY